jgi:hypothetical protein
MIKKELCQEAKKESRQAYTQKQTKKLGIDNKICA